MVIKLITSQERPLHPSEANHLGEGADFSGNTVDVAAWRGADGKIVLHFRTTAEEAWEGTFVTLDVALATLLALRLGEFSAAVIKDLARLLGEDRP